MSINEISAQIGITLGDSTISTSGSTVWENGVSAGQHESLQSNQPQEWGPDDQFPTTARHRFVRR